MSAVGGSIESVSIDGRIYPVAADADATIRTGDPDVEYQANGNSSARKIITKVPWSITGVVLSVDTYSDGIEYIRAIKEGMSDVPITITMANGTVFTGTGSVTGEAGFQTQNSTMTCDFSGPGKLERQ